jgi:hypothetical protein
VIESRLGLNGTDNKPEFVGELRQDPIDGRVSVGLMNFTSYAEPASRFGVTRIEVCHYVTIVRRPPARRCGARPIGADSAHAEETVASHLAEDGSAGLSGAETCSLQASDALTPPVV